MKCGDKLIVDYLRQLLGGMFLAPVNIDNGLAYIGTSPSRHPTLGVYLKWWHHYRDAAQGSLPHTNSRISTVWGC